jgi:hypothetical protein
MEEFLMKHATTICLLSALLATPACSLRDTADRSAARPIHAETGVAVLPAATPQANAAGLVAGQAMQAVPPSVTRLKSAESAQASTQASERKIIRNAELRIETGEPAEGQRKIGAIAEKHGGFVVTSEARQNDGGGQPATTVNVIVRVPAARFAAALDEILGTGGRLLHRKDTGQDVTEEYIDLEASLRTKRALESQFLEIMKQARKVSEALEVQTQLTEVRTEIEQIEGRRRFLENQAALSTITITLQTPVPFTATSPRGFWHDLRSASGDGVEIALSIVLDLLRSVIAMSPILLLIVLPGWLLLKFVRRRSNWPKQPAAPTTADDGNS